MISLQVDVLTPVSTTTTNITITVDIKCTIVTIITTVATIATSTTTTFNKY